MPLPTAAGLPLPPHPRREVVSQKQVNGKVGRYCQLNLKEGIEYRLRFACLLLPMYSRHRCPVEIISYCVWLYYKFPLSYRDIEKMMLDRGVEVTYDIKSA